MAGEWCESGEQRVHLAMIALRKERLLSAGWICLVLLVVAIVYWPVLRADFVWDDLIDFQDMAWLRHGQAWLDYVFRGFNGWQIYFRPLVVALFTLEARLGDGQPGPMHAVSLGLHLINVALVMLLARLIARRQQRPAPAPVVALAGLAFGLHPILVETVTWIGCQFDLVQTLCTLAGLCLAVWLRQRWWRAGTVGLCFLLAALTKESAVCFPILLVILDWLDPVHDGQGGPLRRLPRVLREHWPSYAAILLAGVGYLWLRHWALGSQAVAGFSVPMPPLAEYLHRSSFLFLRYWQMMLGVVVGLSPIHPWDAFAFGRPLARVLWHCALVIGILGWALWALLVRRSLAAALVVAASVCLLPVMQLMPARFDDSLYHDRYATTALSLACGLLPAMLGGLSAWLAGKRLFVVGGGLLALAWLAGAVMNVRVTLPLWSDNVKLWEWAAMKYPRDGVAQNNRLSAYISVGETAKAFAVIRYLADHNIACDNCVLNAALLALREGDNESASTLLGRVENSPSLHDGQMRLFYLRNRGQLALQTGHPAEAEKYLRQAIVLEPLEYNARFLLALGLAKQGRREEAEREGQLAVEMAPSDEEKKSIQQTLEQMLSASGKGARHDGGMPRPNGRSVEPLPQSRSEPS